MQDRIKTDLRTKIIFLIIANILVFLGDGIFYQSLLISFFASVVYLSGHKKIGLSYMAFYSLSILLEKYFFSTELNFLLTLIFFLLAATRKFLPCLIVAKWILDETSPSLAVATLQKLKLNQDAIIMISVLFRAFPTIKDEVGSIYLALKTRGLGISFKNISCRPVKILEYLCIPLVIRVLDIGDDLSTSAIIRGIDAPYQKTSRHHIAFGNRDYLYLFFLVLLIIIIIYLKYEGKI